MTDRDEDEDDAGIDFCSFRRRLAKLSIRSDPLVRSASNYSPFFELNPCFPQLSTQEILYFLSKFEKVRINLRGMKFDLERGENHVIVS